MANCQSLHDYLSNPVAAGSEDKVSENDLESLRESLWMTASGNVTDEITEEQTDKPRWIYTSTMICDPWTKAGSASLADVVSGACMLLTGEAVRKLTADGAPLLAPVGERSANASRAQEQRLMPTWWLFLRCLRARLGPLDSWACKSATASAPSTAPRIPHPCSW